LSTGAWRVLPDAGAVLNQGNGVAAGGSIVVVGSYLDPSNAAVDDTRALRYDPTADAWQALDDPHLSPQATWAVRSNEAIFAWDYEVVTKALVAGADRWTTAGQPAMSFSECYPTGAATAVFALFAFCEQGGLLETDGRRWWPATPPAPFVGPPLALDDGRFLAWTEAGLFTLDPSDAKTDTAR
jgi:hypothetical protein